MVFKNVFNFLSKGPCVGYVAESKILHIVTGGDTGVRLGAGHCPKQPLVDCASREWAGLAWKGHVRGLAHLFQCVGHPCSRPRCVGALLTTSPVLAVVLYLAWDSLL